MTRADGTAGRLLGGLVLVWAAVCALLAGRPASPLAVPAAFAPSSPLALEGPRESRRPVDDAVGLSHDTPEHARADGARGPRVPPRHAPGGTRAIALPPRVASAARVWSARPSRHRVALGAVGPTRARAKLMVFLN